MSNLVCSKCGSTRIMTERRPDGFHHCMYCRHSWKIGESQPKPTVFDRITASPEVLARKVVYPVFDYGNSIGVKIRGYKSPFLDDIYPIWNLAFEKTLAKLKEVCDER